MLSNSWSSCELADNVLHFLNTINAGKNYSDHWSKCLHLWFTFPSQRCTLLKTFITRFIIINLEITAYFNSVLWQGGEISLSQLAWRKRAGNCTLFTFPTLLMTHLFFHPPALRDAFSSKLKSPEHARISFQIFFFSCFQLFWWSFFYVSFMVQSYLSIVGIQLSWHSWMRQHISPLTFTVK